MKSHWALGTGLLIALSIVVMVEILFPASTIDSQGVAIFLRVATATLFGSVFVIFYATYVKDLEASRNQTDGTLRSMLDNLPVGVYRSRREGQIVEANSGFARLLGYESPSELKQVNLNDVFVRESDRQSHLEKLRESQVFAEYELRRKDGTTVWVRDYPKPTLGFDGRIEYTDAVIMETYGIDAIVHDITEHRRLENVKDRFTIAVTHELRTPLISIIGYLDCVLAEDPKVMLKEVMQDLDVAKHNADRLLVLTNDLLDLQRMESGKIQLKLQTVNLRDLIKESVKEMEPLLTQKNQHVHIDLPADGLKVKGDYLRLSQVFTNLLNNAVKFTPSGGDITIRGEEEDDKLRVSVEDTGIGIDRKDIERIFEPFAAIEKPTYYKGTGLGLSLTRRMVEAHGGKILVNSPGKGHGTTFTILLPKKKKEVDIYG